MTIRQGLRSLFPHKEAAITPDTIEPSEAAHRFAIYPSLNGRVVLITEGASGIGAAMVQAFAEQGCRVVFLDIADAEAQALVGHIAPATRTAPVYVHCDLTDFADPFAMRR